MLSTDELLFLSELLTVDRLLSYFPPVFASSSPQCPFYADGIGQLIVRLISPFVCCVLLWLLWLLHKSAAFALLHIGDKYCLSARDHGLPVSSHRNVRRFPIFVRWFGKMSHLHNYILSTIVLFIGSYDGFAETTLQFFICTRVESSSYLLFVPSVQCLTP